MLSILNKELRSFFSNATGYVVIAIFLILTGLFLWVIPGQFNIPDSGYANVDGLFHIAPWLFLFLCPAVSMRLFAEEKQTGTWELLITKPIRKWSIVLGKYFAGWILVLLSLLPTLIYYFSVSYMAEPLGNVDSGAFWGSFLGLVFLSAVYVAIGTFASAVSSNQIIAFVVAVVVSFFMLYGFELLTGFFKSGSTIQTLGALGIQSHYQSMSRGVIDSRDIAYFFLVSLTFLFFTKNIINKKL
ncbi:MAG: gliding motility-associated ABC transporter permease subunit GldF [Paludibacteraceae bacterium]|nr:gliding motility-associated ABC transporter permease subunit GldF [Paludibacteraceae bacterium]